MTMLFLCHGSSYNSCECIWVVMHNSKCLNPSIIYHITHCGSLASINLYGYEGCKSHELVSDLAHTNWGFSAGLNNRYMADLTQLNPSDGLNSYIHTTLIHLLISSLFLLFHFLPFFLHFPALLSYLLCSSSSSTSYLPLFFFNSPSLLPILSSPPPIISTSSLAFSLLPSPILGLLDSDRTQ